MYSSTSSVGVATIKVNSAVSIEKTDKNPSRNLQIFAGNSQPETDDCLACILRVTMVFGGIIGISPITCSCPHSKDPSATIVFKKSISFLVISVILAIAVTTSAILNLLAIVEFDLVSTRMSILQLSNLVLFECTTVTVYLSAIMTNKCRIKELNALVAIIGNKHNCGISSMFGKNDLKSLRFTSKLYVAFVIIVSTIHILQLLLFVFVDKTEYKDTFYRGISSLFCLISQYIYLFQLTLKVKVLKLIFTKTYTTIEKSLNENINQKDNSTEIDISPRKLPLFKMLRKLQRMHCSIILNIKFMNNMMNPFLLLQFLLSVVMLILCYYMLTTIWILGKARTPISLLMEFKIYCIIGGMAYLLSVIESLHFPGDKFQLFLEGFPNTRLSAQEALQVEMLSTSLRIMQPTLSASGVFTVGTSLLAAMTGTIISYVLIALQFQASWAK